jgi:hypothetical protein
MRELSDHQEFTMKSATMTNPFPELKYNSVNNFSQVEAEGKG